MGKVSNSATDDEDPVKQAARSLETEIFKVVQERLASLLDDLRDVGLSVELNDIRRSGEPGSGYWSEISLYLLDGTCIIDAIEFFVYRDGRPAVTAAQADSYVTEILQGLMHERRSSRQGDKT